MTTTNRAATSLLDERLLQELRPWIQRSLEQGENILAISNQGTILLFRSAERSLIVKAAMGRGLVRKAREKTLLREHKAYCKLAGVGGVPACYGLLDGRYLLLEYIEGAPFRDARWSDRDQWFADLLKVLRDIHGRGVSHGDLKSKANLVVTVDEQPCVIDFGTAFIRKRGFHPVNNWMFEMGKRLDINAWVKHKYHGFYNRASPADRQLLDYGWLEVLARKISGRPMDRVDDERP